MHRGRKPLSERNALKAVPSEAEGVGLDERALRVQLAGAYRVFDYLGWTSLIYGHISVRIPGPERHFLINPFGLMYHEVTASNLVKIDIEGNAVSESSYGANPAGFVIHSAIHAARDDAHCIMHTHTTAGMAVAALEDGLQNVDFSGISLHGRVAYHEFEGLTVRQDECARLAENIADKHVMILRNHGLLTCGSTVAKAFLRMWTLENACRVQTAALACNLPLHVPSLEVCESHASALEETTTEQLAFDALLRLMDKRDPTYRH